MTENASIIAKQRYVAFTRARVVQQSCHKEIQLHQQGKRTISYVGQKKISSEIRRGMVSKDGATTWLFRWAYGEYIETSDGTRKFINHYEYAGTTLTYSNHKERERQLMELIK